MDRVFTRDGYEIHAAVVVADKGPIFFGEPVGKTDVPMVGRATIRFGANHIHMCIVVQVAPNMWRIAP
jgi:hypothetical protein